MGVKRLLSLGLSIMLAALLCCPVFAAGSRCGCGRASCQVCCPAAYEASVCEAACLAQAKQAAANAAYCRQAKAIQAKAAAREAAYAKAVRQYQCQIAAREAAYCAAVKAQAACCPCW